MNKKISKDEFLLYSALKKSRAMDKELAKQISELCRSATRAWRMIVNGLLVIGLATRPVAITGKKTT